MFDYFVLDHENSGDKLSLKLYLGKNQGGMGTCGITVIVEQI